MGRRDKFCARKFPVFMSCKFGKKSAVKEWFQTHKDKGEEKRTSKYYFFMVCLWPCCGCLFHGREKREERKESTNIIV